jgi:hypothetical protein
MNGCVFVAPEGFAEDAELDFVVQRCLSFKASLPAK